MNLESLLRKNIRQMKPYSSARDEYEGNASVFLDANENPYPSEYNRYPDPHQKKLKEKIAKLKGVIPEQIFLGNGSDEAIDLLFRAFCEPGVDNVLIPQPTYGMYSVSAELNAVDARYVTLTPDFDIDVDVIKNSWDDSTKLLFLCTPNNPSGNLLSADKIITLLNNFKGLVIVDEAYIDFAGQPGFVPLLVKFPNLIILQTLSKAWGLAGIRLGMCFANREIIKILDKIKPPYNINSMTQSVATSYLGMEDRKNKWVEEIKQQRSILAEELKRIKSVQRVYPSDANFLLIKIKNARAVYDTLVKRGIIVRDRSKVILCDDCLRITVGTSDENQLLLDELRSL